MRATELYADALTAIATDEGEHLWETVDMVSSTFLAQATAAAPDRFYHSRYSAPVQIWSRGVTRDAVSVLAQQDPIDCALQNRLDAPMLVCTGQAPGEPPIPSALATWSLLLPPGEMEFGAVILRDVADGEDTPARSCFLLTGMV